MSIRYFQSLASRLLNEAVLCSLRIRRRRLILECLESKQMLTAIAFVQRQLDDVPSVLLTADYDGDGSDDILSAVDGILFSRFGRVIEPVAADIDGDGDLDVVGQDSNGGIVWAENSDGMGAFTVTPIDTSFMGGFQFVTSIAVEDLEGDGDLDVITAILFENENLDSFEEIHWYENKNGNGDFAAQQVLAEVGSESFSTLFGADVDGDGDVDIFDASNSLGLIFVGWLENLDGSTLGNRQIIKGNLDNLSTCASLRFERAVDLDGDGDPDLLSPARTSQFFGESRVGFHWYENSNGVFAAEPRFIEHDLQFCQIDPVDMDGDGDLDVLYLDLSESVDPFSQRLTVGWYENTDGSGDFSSHHTIATHSFSDFVRSTRLFPADIDGDGDRDVIVYKPGNPIIWHENRLIGDADDNGEVDFDDFLLLAANFGKEVDAVWEEGDFDANEKVDFDDFLALAANFGAKRQQA